MLDEEPGVELLDHVVILFLILRNCHTVFHRVHHLFYLFMFGCAGTSLPHMGFSLVVVPGFSLWASPCCRAGALGTQPSVVAAPGLWSTGLVAAAQGFSGSAVWGIFPAEGCYLCPLQWQADSSPLSHQASHSGLLHFTFLYWVEEFPADRLPVLTAVLPLALALHIPPPANCHRRWQERISGDRSYLGWPSITQRSQKGLHPQKPKNRNTT